MFITGFSNFPSIAFTLFDLLVVWEMNNACMWEAHKLMGFVLVLLVYERLLHVEAHNFDGVF